MPEMTKVDHNDDGAGGPAELPSDVQARWDALADSVRQMASSTEDPESFRAAFNAMLQAGRDLDHRQMLNAVHVPRDAGEHAEALRGMLLRIPDGWGRWISCDRGWYPLLVELDKQLRALLPDYVICQVKEKYGGLRYYWEPGEEVHDPADPEPPAPMRNGDEAEWKRWRRQHETWCERLDVYLGTQQGRERVADLRRRVDLAHQLVEAAERRAATTCERCGATGCLNRTSDGMRWYKTLCAGCAAACEHVLCEASEI